MTIVFQNLLSVLKANNLRHVYYRFSVLAVNFETQPFKEIYEPLNKFVFGYKLYNEKKCFN